MKLWDWFYGLENPYSPRPTAPKGLKWVPDIITIGWWRWCLKHGWNGLARERIRIYYVRRIKYRVLRLPTCWVLGHNKYKEADWGYHCDTCSRCHHSWNYVSHSKR